MNSFSTCGMMTYVRTTQFLRLLIKPSRGVRETIMTRSSLFYTVTHAYEKKKYTTVGPKRTAAKENSTALRFCEGVGTNILLFRLQFFGQPRSLNPIHPCCFGGTCNSDLEMGERERTEYRLITCDLSVDCKLSSTLSDFKGKTRYKRLIFRYADLTLLYPY